MEGTMKCAIFHGIKDVKIEERPIPSITENDVLVKNLRAGICGSDTGAYLYGGEASGIFKRQQFGHEMVGQIVEVGANVKDIKVGDLVYVEPVCAKKTGLLTTDMTGGFSEYVNVEDAKLNHNIYVLPEDIDLDAAALIEPFCVGMHGATCTNPGIDDKVVILGAGTIGLTAAASLVGRGMKNVVVVDQVEWRLEKARTIGAKTINTKTESLEERLVEILGEAPKASPVDPTLLEHDLLMQFFEFSKKMGLGLEKKTPDIDLVVDCAGASSLFQQVFNLSKLGTKYVVVAVYHGEFKVNPSQFIRNEPMIRGSKAYTSENTIEVIDNIIHNKSNISTIVTKKFKHADFIEAIEAACDTSSNIKVLIDYTL